MNSFKKYGVIMALVTEMVVIVLIGFFLGRYGDERLGTSPFLLASGALIGFVAGIYRFYKGAKPFFR